MATPSSPGAKTTPAGYGDSAGGLGGATRRLVGGDRGSLNNFSWVLPAREVMFSRTTVELPAAAEYLYPPSNLVPGLGFCGPELLWDGTW